MPPVDPWDRFDDRMRVLEHRVTTMGEALARIDESLRHIVKMEAKLEKIQQDVDAAHDLVRHNKLVIDMIRWSVALIVPATLSVFAAFAMEVFTR
jgi:hypothetical protein